MWLKFKEVSEESKITTIIFGHSERGGPFLVNFRFVFTDSYGLEIFKAITSYKFAKGDKITGNLELPHY